MPGDHLTEGMGAISIWQDFFFLTSGLSTSGHLIWDVISNVGRMDLISFSE